MSPTGSAGGVNIKDYFGPAGTFNSFGEIISFIFPKILIIGGIIFFVLVIIAGFGVINGSGNDDPHSKEQAKNFLTYAIIGFIIMFGAYWILQILSFVLTAGKTTNLLEIK
jgi:Na+-driven multidrug efflux pump